MERPLAAGFGRLLPWTSVLLETGLDGTSGVLPAGRSTETMGPRPNFNGLLAFMKPHRA